MKSANFKNIFLSLLYHLSLEAFQNYFYFRLKHDSRFPLLRCFLLKHLITVERRSFFMSEFILFASSRVKHFKSIE